MSFISKRYAQALFEFSLEHRCLNCVLQDLSLIQASFDQVSELENFICRADIAQHQFQQFFETLSTTVTLNNVTANFLNLLAVKKRQNNLMAIINDFQELVQQHQSKIKVKVTTAYSLSPEQHNLLTESLEKHLNKRIMLEEIVDTTLISGLIIDCQGFRIDTSLKTQLTQWHNEIRI